MEQEPNQAGGETIWLMPEESLADLPPTHQPLITPEIRTAFAAPKKYFLELAAKTELPGLAKFLEQLVGGGRCALLLATADEMFGGPRMAFQWWVPGSAAPTQLLIEPGTFALPEHAPTGFKQLFSCVRWIHWSEVGYGGGLFHADEQPTLRDYGATCRSKLFPPAATRIFGSNSCGDMLIYNQDEAGFLSHENGKAYSLGSVAQTLNWIFEELRQGREPAFDYER